MEFEISLIVDRASKEIEQEKPPSGPLGRVPATASVAMYFPERENSLSGVLPMKEPPPGIDRDI